MERNAMNNDRRRAIHERRLGDNPACAICGCTNTIVLERIEPAIFLALAKQERVKSAGVPNANEKACAFCGCTNADLLASIEPATLLALVEKARGGQFIILCKTHCNVISGKGAIEHHHTVGRRNQPGFDCSSLRESPRLGDRTIAQRWCVHAASPKHARKTRIDAARTRGILFITCPGIPVLGS